MRSTIHVESTPSRPLPRPAGRPAAVRAEYRCAGCGHGVFVRDLPAACPMCRSLEWVPAGWSPIGRARAAALL